VLGRPRTCSNNQCLKRLKSQTIKETAAIAAAMVDHVFARSAASLSFGCVQSTSHHVRVLVFTLSFLVRQPFRSERHESWRDLTMFQLEPDLRYSPLFFAFFPCFPGQRYIRVPFRRLKPQHHSPFRSTVMPQSARADFVRLGARAQTLRLGVAPWRFRQAT
jgi:hypothetical protein